MTFRAFLNMLHSPRDVAWFADELMLFGFFLCYTYCFLAGRNEYRKHREEHLKFQRLRLICISVVFLDAFWPMQYLLEDAMTQWYKTLVVIIASSTDIAISLCIGTICLRIFSCYYRIKCDPVPARYRAMVLIWFTLVCVVSVLEVLRFAYDNPTFATVFFYSCAVWFSFDAFLLIMLSVFLYRLIRLLYNSYNSVANNLLAKNRERTEAIVKRMTRLTLGFILYLMGLTGAYIYYFIKGNRIQNGVVWIVVHYLLSHFVLYSTFLSYVRPRREHQRSNLENLQTSGGYVASPRHPQNKLNQGMTGWHSLLTPHRSPSQSHPMPQNAHNHYNAHKSNNPVHSVNNPQNGLFLSPSHRNDQYNAYVAQNPAHVYNAHSHVYTTRANKIHHVHHDASNVLYDPHAAQMGSEANKHVLHANMPYHTKPAQYAHDYKIYKPEGSYNIYNMDSSATREFGNNNSESNSLHESHVSDTQTHKSNVTDGTDNTYNTYTTYNTYNSHHTHHAHNTHTMHHILDDGEQWDVRAARMEHTDHRGKYFEQTQHRSKSVANDRIDNVSVVSSSCAQSGLARVIHRDRSVANASKPSGSGPVGGMAGVVGRGGIESNSNSRAQSMDWSERRRKKIDAVGAEKCREFGVHVTHGTNERSSNDPDGGKILQAMEKNVVHGNNLSQILQTSQASQASQSGSIASSLLHSQLSCVVAKSAADTERSLTHDVASPLLSENSFDRAVNFKQKM